MDIGSIQFDSEIIEGPVMAEDEGALELLTVGCSKGSIVVISLRNIDRIRSRFTYHREVIIGL